MNCAKCGAALNKAGDCLSCKPWRRTKGDRVPTATALDGVTADVPRRWLRVVAKHPAKAVDLKRAYYRGLATSALHAVALVCIALVNFHVTTTPRRVTNESA